MVVQQPGGLQLPPPAPVLTTQLGPRQAEQHHAARSGQSRCVSWCVVAVGALAAAVVWVGDSAVVGRADTSVMHAADSFVVLVVLVVVLRSTIHAAAGG